MASDLGGALLDGRYRVGEEIGRGGMSIVYDAEDLELGRRVAVKLVEDSKSSVAERLFREAKAAARADHPAIVTVFGYGRDPSLDMDYLVMERLEGEDLAQRIARTGPLPVDFVARVGAEIADALTAAAQAGVVHRDLKPANIFLARRGLRVDEVKLLDFGVAKHLDMHTLTAPGQMMGTPAYMAPEQILESTDVDARCDIYALGVVLFECLTAQLPFEAPTLSALVDAILEGKRRSLRALRLDVPERLIQLVGRCLQREPAERFQSSREVCDLLLGLGV